MSDLLPCPTCGKALSSYVLTCPYCGRRTRTRKRSRWGGRNSEQHVLPRVEPPDLTDGRGPQPRQPAEPPKPVEQQPVEQQPVEQQAETEQPVHQIEPQPSELQQAESHDGEPRQDQPLHPHEAEPHEAEAQEVELAEAQPHDDEPPPGSGPRLPGTSESPPGPGVLASVENAPLLSGQQASASDGDKEEVCVEEAATAADGSREGQSVAEEEDGPAEPCVAPSQEEHGIEAIDQPSMIAAADEPSGTHAANEPETAAAAPLGGHDPEPPVESDVPQVATPTHPDEELVAVASESPVADEPDERAEATTASNGNRFGPVEPKKKKGSKGIFLLIMVLIAAVLLAKVFLLS